MKTTKTLLGSKARKVILQGVNSIYESVRATFGPYGRNALLYGSFGREPRITNDGYTVAECQEPKEELKRLAATSFKESCKRTNEKVGDGTTATTIIAGKLYNDCYNLIENNKSSIIAGINNPIKIKKQILETVEKVKEQIKLSAKEIKSKKEIENIAVISVENQKIGKIIADMAWEVGVDGFIDVVEGYKGELETEVIKGMRFPAKIVAKGFVNRKDKYEMICKETAVVVTNYKIDSVAQLIGFINQDLLSKNPKIVIFAPEFSNEVISNLYNATYKVVANSGGQNQVVKQPYDTIPVKVPSLRTEQFEDLAIYCGATFIDKNKGQTLSGISSKDLGFLDKLIIKDTEAKEDAVAIGGDGSKLDINRGAKNEEAGFISEDGGEEIKNKKTPIQERVEILKSQLKETRQIQFKKLLERRIASMASAVGVIRVGDSTKSYSYYLKLKIEDAVYACKSALKAGYVKGGGLCLKEIADKLPDDNVLKEALLAPYNQIRNSYESVEITDDIIDPAEVPYYAVEHASQVVANLITCESITAERDDPYYGDGEFAVAKAINEFVITEKIHRGQIKEGEKEMYRDMLNGYTEEEIQTLDNMGMDFNE